MLQQTHELWLLQVCFEIRLISLKFRDVQETVRAIRFELPFQKS